MKITEEEFDKLMVKNDQLKNELQDVAGIVNSIMDGEDPQQFEYTPETAELRCNDIYKEQVELVKSLGVLNLAMVDSLLDSSIVNRWEVYNFILRRQ